MIIHTRINRKLIKKIIARWQLYLILFIPLALTIIFAYVPMAGIVIAFKDYSFRDGIFGSPWVGLEHFQKFLTSRSFGKIMWNTVRISTYAFIAGFPIPILFALVLNALPMKRYKKVVQTVTYMPHFISTAVMVGIVYQLLNNRIGLFGVLYRLLTGAEAPNILAMGKNFTDIYVWSGVWQGFGFGSILYFAALSSVDPGLHEAAIIDGASRWQRIRYIDFPSIRQTVGMRLIFALGGIGVGFEKVYMMQNSLNIQYSEVISTFVYKTGIGAGIPDYSYAAAVDLFNAAINITLLLIVNKIAKTISDISVF